MLDQLHPRPTVPGRLDYAFRARWIGWLVVALGATVLALVLVGEPLESRARWGFSSFGAVAVVFGTLAVSWRHELTVRPHRGRYEHRRGPSWLLTETVGDFSDFESVWLIRVMHDQENDKVRPYYDVILICPRFKDSELVVASSHQRAWAWEEARKLALAIQRPLEETGFDSRRTWSIEQLRLHRSLQS